MARRVNIPTGAVKAGAGRGWNLVRLFCIIKCRGGRNTDGMDLSPGDLDEMARRGWLTRHRGKWYVAKWEKAFPSGTKKMCIGIDPETLESCEDFQALMFTLGAMYLANVQRLSQRKVSPASSGRSPKINAASVHVGGVAHSLCMEFFGKSIGWCSRMRKMSRDAGLAVWRRRFVDIEGSCPLWILSGRCRWLADDLMSEEVASEFIPRVEGRVNVPIRLKSAK